ncbi:hypothetical protein CKAH01_00363 [Colletotrichum kahawae]|uniref:Uncharacterized protein n=1 Tax=Colletotrichum kahawae TaxID=34407 RepID=A0AAE0DGZ8_COLKA|nr:hypothetical protein CKAH01_00363 [Colletotrichum kahawae]
MADIMSCSELRILKNFGKYILAVETETNFTDEFLLSCKEDICGAIWGDTNSDISEIGASIGYAVELALGFSLATVVLLIRQRQGRRWEFFQIITKKGLEAFFEFAVYFAIAVELATTVMLVNTDFGINAAAFEANEAQTALAIAVICVIPLVYPIALLPTRMFHLESATQKAMNGKSEQEYRRQNFRLLLFCLVIVLFFYPFLSQCIHNWGPLRVGEGAGKDGSTLITHDEWPRIQKMCFGHVGRLTDAEYWLLATCEIIASLLIFFFTLWHAMGVGLQRWKDEEKFHGKEGKGTIMLSRTRNVLQRVWHGHRIMLLFLPVVLGGVLLWCIFRLRNIQEAAAVRLGIDYSGNDWGFGQIVSIIIFAPVVADMGFAAWTSWSLLGRDEYDAVSTQGSL